MKLRDILALGSDLAYTIHVDGRLDNHYLEAADVDTDLLDYTVLTVEPSYVPDLTDLYIWVEQAQLVDDGGLNDGNPRF